MMFGKNRTFFRVSRLQGHDGHGWLPQLDRMTS